MSYFYHLVRGIELPHHLPLMEAVVDDLADGDGVVRVPPEGTVTARGGAVVDQSGFYVKLTIITLSMVYMGQAVRDDIKSLTLIMFSKLPPLQKLMDLHWT